jgi:hypothetical protein
MIKNPLERRKSLYHRRKKSKRCVIIGISKIQGE